MPHSSFYVSHTILFTRRRRRNFVSRIELLSHHVAADRVVGYTVISLVHLLMALVNRSPYNGNHNFIITK